MGGTKEEMGVVRTQSWEKKLRGWEAHTQRRGCCLMGAAASEGHMLWLVLRL